MSEIACAYACILNAFSIDLFLIVMDAACPSINAFTIVLEDPPAPNTRQCFDSTLISL